MSYLLSALFSILLAFAWRNMWRKTLIDTNRDNLFDLRDNTRQWFIENNSLDNAAYISLRKLLNSHIQHMESISITSYLITTYYLEKTSNLKEIIENNLSNLQDEDVNTQEYIDHVRVEASNIMIGYMIKQSFLLSMLLFSILPFALLWKGMSALIQILCETRFNVLKIAKRTVIAYTFTALFASICSFPCTPIRFPTNMQRYFNQEQVESYSSQG